MSDDSFSFVAQAHRFVHVALLNEHNVEVSASEYRRVPLVMWRDGHGIVNANELSFGPSLDAWGIIAAVGFYAGPVGPQCIYRVPVGPYPVTRSGYIIRLQPGSIRLLLAESDL